MIEITIDPNRCKGCGLCENVCRQGVISVDPEAETAYGNGCAVVGDGCVGCGMCYTVCPDIAIKISRRSDDV